MPSQPDDAGWNFSSVFDLIDSDVHSISSPMLTPKTPKTRPVASVLQDGEGGVRLGSFAKLFENLGFPDNASTALPPLDPESELSHSDDALLFSSTVVPTQAPEKPIDFTDDQSSTDAGVSKKQRQKARKRAEKERQEEAAKDLAQRATLRRQLECTAQLAKKDSKLTETPTKPSRTQSRSNVSAKIKPVVPGPTINTDKAVAAVAAALQQKEPKTPKASRPILATRSSTAQPLTPQLAKNVEQPTTALSTTKCLQFTTPIKPAPLQQPSIFQSVPQLQPPHEVTPIGQGQGLVPRTVRPATVARRPQPTVAQLPATPTPVVNQIRHPSPSRNVPTLTIRPQVDRHFHLFQKLMTHFPDDRKYLISPMQLINEKTTSHGLHVFVDASNIMIGFKDMLRNHGIQPFQYDMSFDSLALLMERRRPVAKRFFAGSHREANPLPHIRKLVDTSKAVGYDSVMQEQVLIVREESEKKRFFNDVKKHGWHKATQLHSGSGSDSETGPPAPKTPSAPKWVEQGVDEILHLKMCQSILDVEVPSTMVLATGDGAVAEMSDGFLAHVERALRKGWKVELISWGQQTNGGYKNRKFRAKWGEQFQIIELDDFLEDLIDTP